MSPAAIVMNKKRKGVQKGKFINDTLCFMADLELQVSWA